MSKRVSYISLCEDLMGKYILGSKDRIEYTIDLLICLLSMTNEEFRNAKVLNSVKLDKERIFQKGFESDIILETKDGSIYNLEIQNLNSNNSRVKNSMYVMRIFGGKLRKGNEDYEKTKPVFQIVLMNDKNYKNKNNKLIEELVVCSRDSENNYIDDYFKIFVVDLNCEIDYTKFDRKLIGWILLFRAKSFKEARESVKFNPILEGVIRDMREYASEEYVQDYTIRDKLHRSEVNSAREDGISQGERLGISKGISIGRNEGINIGRDKALLETARKMIEKDMDPNDIEEITGITYSEINSLTKNIKSSRKLYQMREEKSKYNQYDEDEEVKDSIKN